MFERKKYDRIQRNLISCFFRKLFDLMDVKMDEKMYVYKYVIMVENNCWYQKETMKMPLFFS